MCKLAAVVIACGAFGVAHGEERNPLDAKLIVDAGSFFVSTDMRVRVDGETTNTTGSDIDFDETFGIGDFDRFRVEAAWRMAERHVLRAMYFRNNRRATRAIDRNITFNDATFPAAANVTAESEQTIAQLSYDYAFLHKEDYEVAAGIGVHYVQTALRLDGTVAAEGGAVSDTRESDATTEAPLPVIGLRALWRFAPNFYLSGQAQYFYLDFDPYSGSLLDLKASVVWQFTDHVGVGLAYNNFGFRFDIDDEDSFNGRLRWDYGGAIAFVSVMF